MIELPTPEPAGESVDQLRDWNAQLMRDLQEVLQNYEERIRQLEEQINTGETEDA